MPSEPNASRTAPVMPRYASVDVIGGAAMISVAALIWYGAIGLRGGTLVNFGPGAMPKVLAGMLFLAGAAVLVRGLRQPAAQAEPLRLALRPPILLGIAIVLFALFIKGGDVMFLTTPRLGLMVVGPLATVVAGLATPEANPRELLVLGFAMTVAVIAEFYDLLGAPLPIFAAVLEREIPPSFGIDAAVRTLYLAYAALAGALYLVFFGRPEAPRG